MTATGPERVLGPEELAALLDDRADWPLPAVLDTSCVRTGLHHQLVLSLLRFPPCRSAWIHRPLKT